MEAIMDNEKKIVHDFNFIGRILELLKILQEETDEYTTISQAQIKKLMKENPAISANEIAEMLNVKAEAVRYRIKLMKKSGEIIRKGATKAGEWEVIE